MTAGQIQLPEKVGFANAVHWQQVGEATIAAHAQVVVDFSSLTGYNSTLLAVLLGYKRAAQAKSCELQWQAVPESLLTLASVYNVRNVLGM